MKTSILSIFAITFALFSPVMVYASYSNTLKINEEAQNRFQAWNRIEAETRSVYAQRLYVATVQLESQNASEESIHEVVYQSTQKYLLDVTAKANDLKFHLSSTTKRQLVARYLEFDKILAQKMIERMTQAHELNTERFNDLSWIRQISVISAEANQAAKSGQAKSGVELFLKKIRAAANDNFISLDIAEEKMMVVKYYQTYVEKNMSQWALANLMVSLFGKEPAVTMASVPGQSSQTLDTQGVAYGFKVRSSCEKLF